MDCEVLFVEPALKPDLKEESVGTLILAKKAILSGFSVRILRYWEALDKHSDYNHFSAEMVNRVLTCSPSVVCFYCRCSDYHICVDISSKIKAANPDVYIVFGGPQAEVVAKETLAYYPFVDYVCCSEGENTIIPFLTYILRSNKDKLPTNVQGLTYRDSENNILQNEFPEFLPNHYVRNFNYYDLIPESVLLNNKGTNIDVGRGCPFSCTFCSTKKFWKQTYRIRKLDNLIDEIEYVYNTFGISNFSFDHDLFSLNKTVIGGFCNELLRRELKVHWYCSSRIDTITKEMIDLMVSAGCYKILFGIETGSEKMQRVINKNLNLNKCEPIVEYALTKGLKIVVSFIYGFPEETEEDFEATIELMQSLQSLGAKTIAWRCGILNGTELYEKYKEHLSISPNNVCNSSFWGFDELYPIIKEHKDVFPHFCDFNNPLRTELKYLEIFRSIWNYYCPTDFERISLQFYKKKYPLLEMYRAFVGVNHDILESICQKPDDKLWGVSIDNCKLMTERFIFWANEAYKS